MHPALVVGRLHQSQRYCGGILGRSWRRSWSLRATPPSSEPLLVGRSGGASSSCLFLLSTRPRCVGRPPSLVRSSLVRWLSSSSSSSAPASSLASPSAGGARKPLPKGVEPRQQQQLSIRDVNDRAMTASERIKIFPTAVMDIWREYQLYNAINAAAATKQNGWHGVVPRHQREQQRHFIESIGVVGPLILVWIPPIIGYLPMFLAIAAPRQVLSRNFHNAYEVLEYMHVADRQRRRHWPTLRERVMGQQSRVVPNDDDDDSSAAIEKLLQQNEEEEDDSGQRDAETVQWLRRAMPAVVPPLLDRRDTVVLLALSVGVYSSLPPLVGERVAVPLSPTSWLRRQVLQWADGVASDDRQLLAERPDVTIPQLSRVELVEACFRRALPTQGKNDEFLRRSLLRHLELVAQLPADDVVKHTGLWTLVWNMIRQSSRSTKTTSTPS